MNSQRSKVFQSCPVIVCFLSIYLKVTNRIGIAEWKLSCPSFDHGAIAAFGEMLSCFCPISDTLTSNEISGGLWNLLCSAIFAVHLIAHAFSMASQTAKDPNLLIKYFDDTLIYPPIALKAECAICFTRQYCTHFHQVWGSMTQIP